MNDKQKQDTDAYFRARDPGETERAYMEAWLETINHSDHRLAEIGQPGPGERIEWRHRIIFAAGLRPGDMIADGRENQTWVRVHRVHVKGTESALGEQEYDIIVVLRGDPTLHCFGNIEQVMALLPTTVSDTKGMEFDATRAAHLA